LFCIGSSGSRPDYATFDPGERRSTGDAGERTAGLGERLQLRTGTDQLFDTDRDQVREYWLDDQHVAAEGVRDLLVKSSRLRADIIIARKDVLFHCFINPRRVGPE
jgi:hypothetical protein